MNTGPILPDPKPRMISPHGYMTPERGKMGCRACGQDMGAPVHRNCEPKEFAPHGYNHGIERPIDLSNPCVDCGELSSHPIHSKHFPCHMGDTASIRLAVLDKGYVELDGCYGTDRDITRIARVSTGSKVKSPEEDRKLLAYLYKNRHTSPFEFCSITFKMKLPLFVRDQFVRHRTAKVNIMSLRYQEAPDEFYEPEDWRLQATSNRQSSEGSLSKESPLVGMSQHDVADREASSVYDTSIAAYRHMVSMGVAREQARMLLGTGLYTEMFMQFDLHNLMHFLRLRDHDHAQWEARQYAIAMKSIFAQLFPECARLFERFKLSVTDMEVFDGDSSTSA